MKGTFSSYLSTAFTIPNLLFLAHATATSKKVRHVSLYGLQTRADQVPGF